MRPPPSPSAPRSISILGATGSVGTSTLAVIAEAPSSFRVEAVTAHRNAAELARIARQVNARFAAVADPAAYHELRDALHGTAVEAAGGTQAIIEAARREADLVVGAIVGAAGLMPVLAAVRRGAMIALANKECLVCGGHLLMNAARSSGALFLPIDSEHNAIFQALAGSDRGDIERLVLTASGGPFRTLPLAAMATVTPEQAVQHPNWSMGAKISVDSATMMNKGLEIIEAHHLFGMPEAQIDVVVHPQSIVHSLVAFRDGSLLAQLGAPDMRIPIAYALGWPARMATAAPRLDLVRAATLTFEAPDEARFPALRLAREALRAGGGTPTILNAANEVAVAAFLRRQIGFLDIARTIERVLASFPASAATTVDALLALDEEARRVAARSLGTSR
jgi:1-deoxy-D-xylulose-5-phosphate reductoisomerase